VQLSLFSSTVGADLRRVEHGGDFRRGRRKLERPVSARRPMHVVLHSERARGAWSMRKHQTTIREALRACVMRSGVRVYEFANVGSHLHLLVRARRREGFQRFLRTFAGIVARIVTGARRGLPLRGGPFWSALAWSRVVAWGRDYYGVRHDIFRNRIEATDGRAIRQALEHGPAP
jgi:REP element-mobilizing transposase RayT